MVLSTISLPWSGASTRTLSTKLQVLPWMSQCTSEEELIADYGLHLRAPWEGRWTEALAGAAVLVAAGLYSAAGIKTASKADALLPSYQKAHFI